MWTIDWMRHVRFVSHAYADIKFVYFDNNQDFACLCMLHALLLLYTFDITGRLIPGSSMYISLSD